MKSGDPVLVDDKQMTSLLSLQSPMLSPMGPGVYRISLQRALRRIPRLKALARELQPYPLVN